MVAYLSATQAWYVEERERLVALAAEKEADRLRAVGALRDVALAAAQRDVESARAVLHDQDAHPDQVAEALLLAARGGVRPAAHDLMRRPAPTAPRVSLREVLASEFHRNPLPAVAPAVAFALICAPRAFVAVGVLAGLAIALAAAAGVVAVFPAFRRLIRRRPRLAFPITLLACIVAALPTNVWLIWAFGVQAPVAASTMTTVLLVVLVVAAGMVATAEDISEEVLEQLRVPVRENEIESLAADRARDALLRDIGQHLHGTVQSGLVAASYAIRSAIERDDPDALDRALEAARRALERDVSPASRSDSDVGDAGLVALAVEWDGLLDIDWHVHGLPPSAVGSVGEVVLECLANAVVHGHASRAEVRVVRGDDHIIVQVEDDGTGPMAGPVGMGSMVLSRATAGDWAITTAPHGGAVVTARVPMP
jgi:signal transduction histidine kinase